MDIREQMAAASVALKEEAAEAAKKLKDVSKERLFRIARKKLQTTLIGAISRFEGRFGHLWGHGKPVGQLTDDEIAWMAVWQECRAEILDNGNNQLRALEKEKPQYSVEWLRYVNKLPVKGDVGGSEQD